MKFLPLVVLTLALFASPVQARTVGEISQFCSQDAADFVTVVRGAKDGGLTHDEVVLRYRAFAEEGDIPEAWVKDTALLIEAVYAADASIEYAVRSGYLGSKYYEHCVEFTKKYVNDKSEM